MWWSIIGTGGSCFVTCTDKSTVLKGHQVWEGGQIRASFEDACEDALAREELIYKRLGTHPQVLRCFGLEEVHSKVHSLRLELAPLGNVRQFIEDHANDPLPEHTRLRMALDVATGLSYVHSRNIHHSDLSCRNLFLFKDYSVKIGDFGGSIIEGYGLKKTVYEESQYELPCRGRDFRDRPVVKREIFALGMAIYEIMAWKRPFQGLRDEEVETRYAREEFPSLDGITISPIIRNCWIEEYETVDEVVESLRKHLRLL